MGDITLENIYRARLNAMKLVGEQGLTREQWDKKCPGQGSIFPLINAIKSDGKKPEVVDINEHTAYQLLGISDPDTYNKITHGEGIKEDVARNSIGDMIKKFQGMLGQLPEVSELDRMKNEEWKKGEEQRKKADEERYKSAQERAVKDKQENQEALKNADKPQIPDGACTMAFTPDRITKSGNAEEGFLDLNEANKQHIKLLDGDKPKTYIDCGPLDRNQELKYTFDQDKGTIDLRTIDHSQSLPFKKNECVLHLPKEGTPDKIYDIGEFGRKEGQSTLTVQWDDQKKKWMEQPKSNAAEAQPNPDGAQPNPGEAQPNPVEVQPETNNQ